MKKTLFCLLFLSTLLEAKQSFENFTKIEAKLTQRESSSSRRSIDKLESVNFSGYATTSSNCSVSSVEGTWRVRR